MRKGVVICYVVEKKNKLDEKIITNIAKKVLVDKNS